MKNFIAIITVIITVAIALLIGPWFLMKGWNFIAWKFNLPTFTFWQCFFIGNGFRWLIGATTRLNVKAKTED